MKVMNTLEHIIEAAKTLPPEDRRRLQEWLIEQERLDANEQPHEGTLRQEIEKYHQAKKWIAEHRTEYLGQWVALDGDHLISHGSNAVQVHNEAKAAGQKAPFVVRIIEEPEFYVGGFEPCPGN
jgi:Family of unknown function (DUF5678)